MTRSNGRLTTGDSSVFQIFQCHFGWEGGAGLVAESCRTMLVSVYHTLVKTVTVGKGRVWLWTESVCLNTTLWL